MALDICLGSIYAAVVPDQLMSRVMGAFQAVNYGTRPLGALTAGSSARSSGYGRRCGSP